jgi:hypothetical protein
MEDRFTMALEPPFALPPNHTLPPTVFKYQPVTTYALENIAKRSVYFNSPRRFNDPFDCTITVRFRDLTTEDIEQVRTTLMHRMSYRHGSTGDFSSLSADAMRERFLRLSNETFNGYKERFLNDYGVSCFSERNHSLLMWAHYAESYKGICLEFRTEHIRRLWPVSYTSEIPVVDLVRFTVDRDPWQIMDLYCTKSESWSYEKEWRAIHVEVNTTFKLPTYALKAIYLGTGISDENRESVRRAASALPENVQIWQAKKSETEFRLEFECLT